MKLSHPVLIDLLQCAYSAEKAAAFAYQGHAGSIKNATEKIEIRQIEIDEWNHREEVLAIMRKYEMCPDLVVSRCNSFVDNFNESAVSRNMKYFPHYDKTWKEDVSDLIKAADRILGVL